MGGGCRLKGRGRVNAFASSFPLGARPVDDGAALFVGEPRLPGNMLTRQRSPRVTAVIGCDSFDTWPVAQLAVQAGQVAWVDEQRGGARRSRA